MFLYVFGRSKDRKAPLCRVKKGYFSGMQNERQRTNDKKGAFGVISISRFKCFQLFAQKFVLWKICNSKKNVQTALLNANAKYCLFIQKLFFATVSKFIIFRGCFWNELVNVSRERQWKGVIERATAAHLGSV